MLRVISIIIATLLMLSTNALAADWVAKNLRGGVFVFEDNAWVQIKRGHVVSDASAIQTAKGARVTFVRGKESISVRADTRIRISDKNGAQRTVVSQDFGQIIVDVEKKNVEHFEVRSPILAAVVKGTKFTVTARNGVGSIDVDRGRVEARDNKAGMKVDVKPGQDVSVDVVKSPVLVVKGRGKKEPIRSTATGAVLSVKQIIRKSENARPSAPVNMETVVQVAAQQGVELSVEDQEYAAAKQLAAAEKSGNVAAVQAALKTAAAAKSASNAGGNSASAASSGNSNNANSNAGGNSASAASSGNGDNANSNAGGNSASAASSGNSDNANSNAGGNSESAASSGNSDNANSNAGGNGNGNGKNT